ncbi:olfactory receptor 6C4-like [Aquarana catesbeiana]|uniref:olfactory receptor 6C4-like n=1 Tax=Aquarana catesbeiana TaxID=8400 RepID=UPI003CC93F4B
MTHLKNQTLMIEVWIVGFENLSAYKIPLFLFLLLIYILTCFENLLIIFLVNKSPHLHSPMYFLISNFIFCQFFYTTNLVPRMLHDLLSEIGVTSYLGCIVQLSILGGVSDVESFLYVMMSYDRYLAICQPLRYSTLMHNRLCLYVVIVFWLISSAAVAVVWYFLINVELCGPVRVNHFHCDFTTLMVFACSDIAPLMFLILVISGVLSAAPLVAAVVSYTFIIIAVLRIKSSKGRKKAFSTCSSHLLVLGIYFAMMFTLYVVPRNNNYFQVYKGMSFIYLSVTPLINPIIYTLRNKDFHKALQAAISEMKQYVIVRVQ